jgi:hypothetical protein
MSAIETIETILAQAAVVLDEVPDLAPGIYRDVPAETYHKLPYASASRLKMLLTQTPKHLRWDMDNPREDTPALRLGSALHTFILEPEKFDGLYVEGDQCVATKKTGEACTSPGKVYSGGQWWCGVHGKGKIHEAGDKKVLEVGTIARLQAMRASVMELREARNAILNATDRELTVIWDDPEVGERCKARIDLYRPGVLDDLKTCEDANNTGDDCAFARQIADYAYHLQAAMYCDAMTSVAGEVHDDFNFIAIEKSAPFVCSHVRLHQEAIMLGRHQYRQLLGVWKYCRENKVWPGYGSNAVALPRYYMQKEMRK